MQEFYLVLMFTVNLLQAARKKCYNVEKLRIKARGTMRLEVFSSLGPAYRKAALRVFAARRPALHNGAILEYAREDGRRVLIA